MVRYGTDQIYKQLPANQGYIRGDEGIRTVGGGPEDSISVAHMVKDAG